MPFRHAHWYLLAVFPLAGLAFWQSYLSQFASAPVEFHAHGITASLWLTLLTVQSWTIHRARKDLHRQLGLASLVLFPLFLAGGATIFVGMAQRFVGQVAPFYTIYPPRLVWLDVVSVIGFAHCYLQALRQRRRVHPHSRYMLSTVFFLLPPILGRLAPALPRSRLRAPRTCGSSAPVFSSAMRLPRESPSSSPGERRDMDGHSSK